jgi:deoxyribodipyrimidine photolyase
MIKKYLQYIKEADEVEQVQSQQETSDPSKYEEVSSAVKTMIEKTIEKSGGEFSSFVDSLLKNPEDVKIEGFINDSDIYEFYLKWRNDIDEILNNVKFFGEVPTEINAFGLYEYVIKGTERAMNEVVKMLS